MKKRVATLILCIVAICDAAASQVAPRVPLTGYVARSGKVVEPAIYQGGSTGFRGDWVAVSKDGKGGYLNLRTHKSTGFVFDQVADDYERALFANGPEPVRIGDKWGFVNEQGEVVIAPRFDGARGFGPEGRAIIEVAQEGGFPRLQGFIDKAGNIIVEPKYEMLWRYHAGLAVFQRGGRSGALDVKGREAIPPRFGFLGWFDENGLAPATLNGGISDEKSRYGYVDRRGEFVIPVSFRYAGSFQHTPADGGHEAPDGLARVALENGQIAFIDATGRIVTRFPAGVGVTGISSNGLARFQNSVTAKYGFADRTGTIVIPARFEQVGGFDAHGLASAQENGKAGYIRADGSWAIQPLFSLAGSFDDFGQAQAVRDGEDVLIDRTGRTVATLPRGTSFYWQQSDYAAFRVYPPQINYPAERFGRWQLERILYAVPEVPSLHSYDPIAIGSVRLAFRTSDGLIRWSMRTEGRGIELRTEQGLESEPDITGQTQLAALPPSVDALIELWREQLNGRAEFSIARTPSKAGEQAEQRERLNRIVSSRPTYLEELAASAPDLNRALQAARTQIAEQFGTK